MHRTISQWLLILGLAYVFVFFGIGKIVHPLLWMQWIPSSFEELLGLSRGMWLTVFGMVEVLLGGLLLIPERTLQRVVALLMVLYLLAVLLQTGFWNDTGIRDTGLLFMALGLFSL